MPTDKTPDMLADSFFKLDTSVTMDSVFVRVVVESPVVTLSEVADDTQRYRVALWPSRSSVLLPRDEVLSSAVILEDSDERILPPNAVHFAVVLRLIAKRYATADGFANIDNKLVSELRSLAFTKKISAQVANLFPKVMATYDLSAEDFNKLSADAGAVLVHPGARAPSLDDGDVPPAQTPRI